jgi:hypothetical protein
MLNVDNEIRQGERSKFKRTIGELESCPLQETRVD